MLRRAISPRDGRGRVWKEYLKTTRDAQARGSYDAVEAWAWERLLRRLEAIAARFTG
jgi:hypothetical protein